jgi:alkylhydroperoxidase/carboxymuconolactone decarboxylase family protein YurZ
MAKKNPATYLPAGAGIVATQFPNVWEQYTQLGKACSKAGPLNERERRLVKLGLAIGAGLEGAVHSHVRRGVGEVLAPDEIRHIALLSIPTLGLPAAVRALTWIDDVLDAPRQKGKRAAHLKTKK